MAFRNQDQMKAEPVSQKEGAIWPPTPLGSASIQTVTKPKKLLTSGPLFDCCLGFACGVVPYYVAFIVTFASVWNSMEYGDSLIGDKVTRVVHGLLLVIYVLLLRRYPWFAGTALAFAIIGWFQYYGHL